MSTRQETQRRRALQKLWNKLDDHLLPYCKSGVVLAISGGPDSRALLEALASWPKRRQGHFLVATIDHGIRKGSDQEARLVKLRAERLGFDASMIELRCSSMSEHTLRNLRYQALKDCARARACKVIATGHQGNDNAEGYLMALLGVGGGELGASMSEVENIDGIVLCRPFLSLTKGDLLLALTFNKHTDFVQDQCDEVRVGKRALIRYDVIPELQQYAPTLISRLQHFGRAQSMQRSFVEKAAAELIEWRGQYAVLSLKRKPETVLLVSALWQIIKRFSNESDLRSVGSLILAIAEEVVDNMIKNPQFAGLDPSTNAFNLKSASVKHYQVPGAVVLMAPGEIQVRRV